MARKPIIYINSWPGVGKHTIARALAARLGPETRVIHNHLHIDLTEAVLPRSAADYQFARKMHRQATFRILEESEESWNHVYIFTDFQTSNALGRATAAEYRDAAVARGCAFIPVVLDCDVQENKRRMVSERRVNEVTARGKGMLLDTEVLAGMRGRGEVYRFGCPEEMVVDVSWLGVEEAVDVIVGHVREVMKS